MLQVRKKEFIVARTKMGWSQVALAEKASLSPAAVSRIENGSGVSERSALKISDALGEDLLKLFDVVLDPAGQN